MKSKTLLIIDDSAEDRAAFRRYLTRRKEQHYQIVEVDSAEEGLEHLRQNHIDLVLLDYSLPGIDGLTFIQKLQAQTDSLTPPPVLMLTGQGDERIAAQSIKAGAQDYIIKQPQMEGVLNLAVRTALREAALQSQVQTYQAQQVLVQDVVLRIRQSLDVQSILTQTSLEVRKLLKCDRVLLYRFLPDGSGTVEVESVRAPHTSIQGQTIVDSCFKNGWIDRYLAGESTKVENVRTAQLTTCHVELLSQFGVQASLAVPILMTTKLSSAPFYAEGRTLWGLLIIHQCSAPRTWKNSETQLLRQICDQLAIALQQSALYEQLKEANQQLENKVAARTAQLKKANQQLIEANNALKASNRDLEQFAYIASHDLREPLRKVRSFAELFAKRYRGEIDENGDRYIDYITNGAERMQKLISDLLAYSKLGRNELRCEETDINESLSQAIETLSDRIIETQAVIQASRLPTLAVDALQIEQLFFNLIDNALKYSNAAPQINIHAVQQAHCWKFYIKDNGIGIAPEFQDRIFAIFQRLHSKNEYSGTGIGLAICQKIVERHGGEIGIEPLTDENSPDKSSPDKGSDESPDKGTTFWFTLPITDDK